LGLLIYALVVSALILAVATTLSERREKTVWREMLAATLERDARAAGLVEPDTDALPRVRIYDLDAPSASVLPREVRSLAPGFHERVTTRGVSFAILVHKFNGHRIAAVSDVSGHERAEQHYFLIILAAMAAGVGLLLVVTWWLAGRLVRPVVALGERVHSLDPGHRGDRVDTGYAQHEVRAIESAVNGFLQRLDDFVVREREFIDTVSHELRTPIAVIAGAAAVLDDAIPAEAASRSALDRIHITVEDMDETIAALLFLAKDPTAFAVSEPVRLDELLPGIINDHASLAASKHVAIDVLISEPTLVMAPARIAVIAVGNMLRNAIEHTPAGTIKVSLADGVIAIDNAVSDVDPATISARYRSAARMPATRPVGAGIGLYVIRRLCDRLGWALDFEALSTDRVRCRLDLRSTVVAKV
jgi:signal transduction histidine kinase